MKFKEEWTYNARESIDALERRLGKPFSTWEMNDRTGDIHGYSTPHGETCFSLLEEAFSKLEVMEEMEPEAAENTAIEAREAVQKAMQERLVLKGLLTELKEEFEDLLKLLKEVNEE